MNLRPAVGAVLVTLSLAGPALGLAARWNNFARDPHHSALFSAASQSLEQVHWQTPVDLNPQYVSNKLPIHYGSPLVTSKNTVIVPVKTGAQGGFQVEARSGTSGRLIWSLPTDYILPPHNWTPVFGPALSSEPRVYFPGAGGTVYFRDSPDSAAGIEGRLVFYGKKNFFADPSAYNASVMINTPITTDRSGNIFFGFQVIGDTPVALNSGIARINSRSRTGTWIAAAAAANDNSITKVVDNCAPALSPHGRTVYVAVSNGLAGYLVALDSRTLAPKASVPLKDPKSGSDSLLSDNGSASPTVGPDGEVYFGVLENPSRENNGRGWLLHFDSTLSQSKIPGAFGWDDTAAVVPSSLVKSYKGTSTYLLMSKYNNYANVGSGNGQNKIAVLDPNATEIDPVTGATVMQEVLTILGPTPNPPLQGVKEWCINSAAVDRATKAIMANSEDGKLYRWDLTSNTLSQAVTLTLGLGEAYTPTVIGVDGTVYAINNAMLFAVGTYTAPADSSLSASPSSVKKKPATP
jgi:hypothetical protein